MSGQDSKKKRLRKQPDLRRVYNASAAPLPSLTVPKTASKRKRRNSQQRIRQPLSGVRRFVLSSRWISLGILAACVYTLFLIGQNDSFYLNYIPVEGTGSIPPTEIVERSGLAGKHIFAADPQGAADAIAAMDGVESADVLLRWPNEISIQVREDSPLALWLLNDQMYWVLESGKLIPSRTETVGLLQIVSELADVTPRPGTTEALEAATISSANRAATTESDDEEAGDEVVGAVSEEEPEVLGVTYLPDPVLVGALQLRQLRPNIDQLYYRPSGGLSYQDGRGWRAYFGTGEDMHQKLAVYETVVEDLLARGIRPEYISVSNQERPFYKAAP